MIETESERSKVDHLAELARAAAMAPVGADAHVRGRTRLVDAASRLGRAERLGPAAWVGIAAALFAVVAVVAVAAFATEGFSRLRSQPLTYRVEGAGTFESNYVSPGKDAPAVVRFSDGSRVTAQPETGLRIAAPGSQGATLFVERGAATADIVHRSESAWRFVAGPFEVRVTGTRFTLAWDPRTEEMDLVMHEGSVEVRSPIGEGHFSVRAGQRFHASVSGGTTKLENLASTAGPAVLAPSLSPPVSPAGAPVASGVIASPGAAPPARAPGSPESDGASWADLVRHGKFEEVVTRATRSGIETCLSQCSAQDLRGLADAARYTSRADLATRSLLALRKRFASGQGSTAAFLLGRTQESSGALAAADDWYRTYLSEAPDGEFAAEALGGRMRAVSGLRGPAAARPFALEYLERYPKGASARAARGLTESH